MIAADTSTWVAFLEGTAGDDTLRLDKALQDGQLVMVLVVLTELLSDPKLPPALAASLSNVPLLQIESGFGNGPRHCAQKCSQRVAELASPIP
jgi:hypothetical protein